MISLPWRKIGSKELKECFKRMHCTPEENLECARLYYRMRLTSSGFM